MAKSRKVLASMAATRGMVLVQVNVGLKSRAYKTETVPPESYDVLMWAVPRVGEKITLEDGRTVTVKEVRHAIENGGTQCLTIVGAV